MGEIVLFSAETAPDDVAEDYMRGLAQQISLTPAYLNRIDMPALRQPGKRLAVLRHGRALLPVSTLRMASTKANRSNGSTVSTRTRTRAMSHAI
ncbi:MAG: hypothetical protein AAF317_10615 [Pseudomonadota bacterium]